MEEIGWVNMRSLHQYMFLVCDGMPCLNLKKIEFKLKFNCFVIGLAMQIERLSRINVFVSDMK